MSPIVIRITSNRDTMCRDDLQKNIVQLFSDHYKVSVSYEDDMLQHEDLIPTYIRVIVLSVSHEVVPLLSTLLAGETVTITYGGDTFHMVYRHS
jgi:hypothetical protein